jgi:polysaccharide export outer membrane protein
MLNRIRLRGCLALSLLLPACSSVQGPFVWADDYRATPEPRGYTIAVGDLLAVQVWDAERYSTRARVRPDGQISVPLLNDLEVVGRSPADVSRIIEDRLRKGNLLVSPHVTIAVEEIRPGTVSVAGAVVRPGTHSLDHGMGVVDALASAGGLTEFAHKDRIFVMRRDPTPVRIRFSLSALTDSIGPAALFRLRPGDIVFAED